MIQFRRIFAILTVVSFGLCLPHLGFAQAPVVSESVASNVSTPKGSSGNAASSNSESGKKAETKNSNKPKVPQYDPQPGRQMGSRAARLFDHDKKVSVDEVAFHLYNFRNYNIKDPTKDGGDVFFKENLSAKYATVDRTEEQINNEVNDLIKHVGKFTKAQKIQEMMTTEYHPYWLRDSYNVEPFTQGSREGREYWYKYFLFRKHNVKVEGEQDPRICYSLTIYSIDVPKEQAEADRVALIEERNEKEGRNDPTNAKDPLHLFLKSKDYVLDPNIHGTGNGNFGYWFDKEGNILRLESR